MNQTVTKQQLATVGMDALDRDRVGQVQVSTVAGGVSFATALEVMEFAKLMSVSSTAVPKHLRNNPGQCLAVTFQAVEWRMSPFAVANKSYEVNDRIAYESQLIHAVIEARAPLNRRLSCEYEGEGAKRCCIVKGSFDDGSEREYRSPPLSQIKKNSPLWEADPDQQLWYYASRSWCRKWCPDVILGIYAREELATSPTLGRDEEPAGPTLIERLSKADRTEGHNAQTVDSELANVAAGGKVTILPPDETKADGTLRRRRFTGKRKNAKSEPETMSEPETEAEKAANPAAEAPPIEQSKPEATDTKPEPENRTQDAPAAKPKGPPKNASEYIVYCDGWMDKATDYDDAVARWDGEEDDRNRLLVSIKARLALRHKLKEKFGIDVD